MTITFHPFDYYTKSYYGNLVNSAYMSSLQSHKAFRSVEQTFDTLKKDPGIVVFLENNTDNVDALSQLQRCIPSAMSINYAAIYSAPRQEKIELIGSNDFGMRYDYEFDSKQTHGSFPETISSEVYSMSFRDIEVDENRIREIIDSDFYGHLYDHELKGAKEDQGDEGVFALLKDHASKHLVLYMKIGEGGSYIALGLNSYEMSREFIKGLRIPGYYDPDKPQDTGIYVFNNDGMVICSDRADYIGKNITDTEYFKRTLENHEQTVEGSFRWETDTTKYIVTSFSIQYDTTRTYVMGMLQKSLVADYVSPGLLQQHLLALGVCLISCILLLIIIYRSFSPFDKLVSQVSKALNVKPEGAQALSSAVKMAEEKVLLDFIKDKPLETKQIEGLLEGQNNKFFLCVQLDIDDYMDKDTNLIEVGNKITQKLLSSFGYVYNLPLETTKTLFVVRSNNKITKSQIKDTLIECQRSTRSQNLKLLYIVGSIQNTIYNLPQEYALIKSTDNAKMCYGNEAIIFCDELKEYSPLEILPELDNELIKYLKTNNVKKIKELCDQLFYNLKQSKNPMTPQYLAQVVFNVIKFILTYDTKQNMFDYESLISTISEASNLQSAQDRFALFLSDACRYISSIQEPSIKVTSDMQKLLAYIEDNYGDSNFSLSTAVEYFGYSQQYLGRIFKAKFETTFIQYLTEFRLEKAKSLLLHSDLSIKEIASEVGIYSSSYFGYMFKKQFGVTPTDIRKEESF